MDFKYTVTISGNGACLFLTLRLCLEITASYKSETENLCFLGFCDHLMADAKRLRDRIVDWYEDEDASVPQLGRFDEKSGTLWRRKTIVDTELAKTGSAATPELRKAYLEKMRHTTVWGSTPEYTAFALLSGRAVMVWQQKDGAVKLIDTVAGNAPIINIFFRNNHYEPILTEAEKVLLESRGKIDTVRI